MMKFSHVKKIVSSVLFIMIAAVSSAQNSEHFIRVNLLGYLPTGSKTAVWCSKVDLGISNLPAGRQGWELVDAVSKKTEICQRHDRL